MTSSITGLNNARPPPAKIARGQRTPSAWPHDHIIFYDGVGLEDPGNLKRFSKVTRQTLGSVGLRPSALPIANHMVERTLALMPALYQLNELSLGLSFGTL